MGVTINIRISASLQGWVKGKSNLFEEVTPGLVLNQIKEFTEEMDKNEGVSPRKRAEA